MKLVHYTKQPLYKVVSIHQPEYSMKPQGFWVSVEGTDSRSWKDYCQAVPIFLEDFKHAYEVTLKDDANVLWIKDVEEFDAFEKEWTVPDPDYKRAGLGEGYQMDWQRLAKKYQGIIITPYLYGRRFGPLWYYAWDCASGCIWDADAIASVVQEEALHEKTA